jgi:hypothetical protein
MNKEQIKKQYLLWNREQRPTSFTTDFLSEAVDPINWLPTARVGASYKIFFYIFAPKIGVFHYFFNIGRNRLGSVATEIIYCACKGWKIAPSLSPIKSRFAVGGADAFSVGYAQSELMVLNKGFMSEQEKDNQVAVSSILLFYLFFIHQIWVKSILL